ncbi:proton-conducting transporter transmembrane domain-containing protein [Demequina lutea]|uniref:Formate hydrogenlyase subunit 3/multisubunit Na+/H+ antiporter MnhD subunit n=1 Tax=Demequina lutea TaxID=431489 RepID=A0A7Y9Z9X4_9MICO|nr:proton-conducting transporter membrane subunit [Demequina lutea]NYI41479.1 formate hydrogenlyase subunit 3/multisubunit Na+/H+ antiporter MnhD subunit [Demequina lutea]
MNLIEMGLFLAAGGALLGALAIALVPRRVRPLVGGLVTAGVGVGGVLAGIGGLTGAGAHGGAAWTRIAPGLLPLGEARLSVDALSGVFLLLVGAVAIAAGVYGIGYTADGAGHANPAGSRTTQATVPLFVASMIFVPASASVTTLLVVWELMALTSLVLVLTEHRLRPSVRDAGLWYAGMTHAGLVAIMTGLVVFASGAGGESFDALRAGAAHLSPAARSTVFVLVFIGFGAKAGLVPLHVWLPRAHPEAPSHVSALMSAAMVSLGIYGLIRVGFDLLGGGPRWWGLLVLAIGAVSALFGVLQASVATDLKRLLAYSTTENVGLMAIGIGASGVFAADGNRALAGVLMAAAVLHALNHAAFKTVLFLGAGSVLRATGLRDLDALGGLVRRMPLTTALFGIGALGAAALPPGNGFVSEWVLLQGLIHSIHEGISAAPVVAVSIPVAVGVVALTAGLGVATFVKAFGVGFLAQPRSTAAATATESPMPMRVGMGIAGATCVVLGVAPAVAGGALDRVLNVLPAVRNTAPLADSAVTLRLAGIAGSMSPLLIACGLALSALVVFGVVRRLTGGAPRRVVGVWANGRTERDSRQELTATSFAEPLTRVFDDVLRPEHDIDITPYAESSYLIESVTFRQRVPDRLEAAIYPPLLATLSSWGEWSRRMANGRVHRYLAYGFLGLLGALVVVAVTT